MSTPLAQVLEGQHAADVRKAARALLAEPLLLAHGPHADAFRLVRQHATELREWFDRNTGWPLQVDAETARLRKTPGTLTDPTHPAREAKRSAAPFTRRRYVTTDEGSAASRRVAGLVLGCSASRTAAEAVPEARAGLGDRGDGDALGGDGPSGAWRTPAAAAQVLGPTIGCDLYDWPAPVGWPAALRPDPMVIRSATARTPVGQGVMPARPGVSGKPVAPEASLVSSPVSPMPVPSTDITASAGRAHRLPVVSAQVVPSHGVAGPDVLSQ
ncbi:DUF2398 family protein [Streptomyces violascens]|uniref:DUF2398 family protein n=1 Tax=Streptomyces violascens TaxID=67381 RepID=UPI0036772571